MNKTDVKGKYQMPKVGSIKGKFKGRPDQTENKASRLKAGPVKSSIKHIDLYPFTDGTQSTARTKSTGRKQV